MILSDISVKRPVFAVMISTALIVLGLFSYRELGVDLMPKTDIPSVSVLVFLPGAGAEEIETEITKPVEEAVNTINGIDEMYTTTDQGFSRLNIYFVLERDVESAIQDVREKVASVTSQFPTDTLAPLIQKIDPDAAPILTVVVSGERSAKEITDIADRQIKQVLETAKDVGEVTFVGDRRREIQLLLNADRMTAYGLTVDQVRSAVQRQNVEAPGGTFVAGQSEIALRTMGRVRNVADFDRIVLSHRDGAVVTFADIGRVADTVEEPRSVARLNGKAALSLLISKQSGTNTIEVVDAVMARLDQIKSKLPSDIKVQTIRDQSRFIRRSLDDIKHHLILGGLLASLVVFVFLRNVRSTIIAALAIPTSIIGTFSIMKAFGFTLNNMTLLAMSLATGIVIDDAIVVLENVFRFVKERGITPREAAVQATDEIGLAVMATTLSLVVIFVPVAFMTGQVGRYFFSFGICSAAAILISMLVSFTLTPALCSWWLRESDAAGDHASQSRGFYSIVDRQYGRMLSWSLRHRAVMLVTAAAVSLSVILLFPRIGKELVPDDDQSEFTVNVRLPKGTSLERTDQYVSEIERDLRQLPEVDTVFANVNAGGGNFYLGLTPLESRQVSQQELMRRARAMLRRYQGSRISVSGSTDLSGAAAASNPRTANRLSVLIQGPDIDQLQIYANTLSEKMRKIRGIADLDTNFEATQPELRIDIDRERATDLGVSIDSISADMRALVGGREISKYKEGDDRYTVRLRLDERFRSDPAALGDLLVPSSTQRAVRLSDVAQLRLGHGPSSIFRYNRQRQISLFTFLDNLPMGEAVAATRSKLGELNLKVGYSSAFGGGAKQFNEASGNFIIAILLAVAFIYMVLASQFNSFIHPLTIMTALPLSLPAGLISLMAFGMSLNVYSAIGLIMLFGIVKKNSILQVDYTNTLREAGMERHQAMIRANHVRLRPILMTTISIIAGMIPIAFGRGAGAGSRASMAVTIIGGQVLCLLLTLLITPVVYSYFDDLREWRPARNLAGRRSSRATLEPGTSRSRIQGAESVPSERP